METFQEKNPFTLVWAILKNKATFSLQFKRNSSEKLTHMSK